MSLHPSPVPPVPIETLRVARAAFPRGNLYVRMRDTFATLFEDAMFAPFFPARGQPAAAPWRLALATIFQFAEGLSDQQAADAVRSRIDWKYALSLELTDAGFDSSVLCEFRARLLAHAADEHLLDIMLNHFRAHGLLKVRGRQRTDSPYVLTSVRILNRLACVNETVRFALNSVATVAPDWLRHYAPPEWYERYSPRTDGFRLPKTLTDRQALAEQVGADGVALLQAVYASDAPAWLREVPAIQILRRIWVQQYYAPTDSVRWRIADDLPPSADMFNSPYDLDARYAMKRETQWTGYKVHVTETCDEQLPHFITHVATTPATSMDYDTTATVQAGLAARDLLPAQQIVDTGYVDSDNLLTRHPYDVDLVGPVPGDQSWQARTPGAFDHTHFTIDWDVHRVTCPAGCTNRKWAHSHNQHGKPTIQVVFRAEDCQACTLRPRCTRRGARMLSLRPQAQYLALQIARHRERSAEFRTRYAQRAGVEGTLSQGVRAFGLRRSRYVGLRKTHLQHVFTAMAMNWARVGAWLADTPLTPTRSSAFARLAVRSG